jgi:hypothetical protein
MGETQTDSRGISELASVMTLVLIAVVIVAAIGLNVLFLEEEASGPEATFSFNYNDDLNYLTITHDGGDSFAAGNLSIQGPQQAEARWSELNDNMDESSLVEKGDIVRIGPNNAYGDRVRDGEPIRVVHIDPVSGSVTVLSQWNGTSNF